jgi:hypothetical protein
MMQSWFIRRVPIMLAATMAVVLVGCASRPAAQSGQAPDDSVCRQEAYNDPQVHALFNDALPPYNQQVFDIRNTTPREDAQYAYRQALQACMQRRGLITSGGVEPVRQYPFSPLGF